MWVFLDYYPINHSYAYGLIFFLFSDCAIVFVKTVSGKAPITLYVFYDSWLFHGKTSTRIFKRERRTSVFK